MAEQDDKDSRSEEPSEKKLQDARKKGDVPLTKEVGHLMIYGSLLALASLVLPSQAATLAVTFGDLIAEAPRIVVSSELTGVSDIFRSTQSLLQDVFWFLAKVLLIMLCAAIISGLLQGPFVSSMERIRPKPSKISPLKGFSKIFSGSNLVEFLKNTTKLTVFAGISLWIVFDFMDGLLPGGAVLPEDLPGLVNKEATVVLAWVCGMMFPIVIFDFIWKRHSHRKKQRMSMKELKDEHKETEGDPIIRQKRQEIRRERARQRIATAVPTATLILTNPTHFSVALRYEKGVDMAPVCVAKGADLMAHRIRQIAHDNDVPVIESRQLARALYATVEVDQAIPEVHWPAVAELVSFVLSMRSKIKRQLPQGAQLRYD